MRPIGAGSESTRRLEAHLIPESTNRENYISRQKKEYTPVYEPHSWPLRKNCPMVFGTVVRVELLLLQITDDASVYV